MHMSLGPGSVRISLERPTVESSRVELGRRARTFCAMIAARVSYMRVSGCQPIPNSLIPLTTEKGCGAACVSPESQLTVQLLDALPSDLPTHKKRICLFLDLHPDRLRYRHRNDGMTDYRTFQALPCHGPRGRIFSRIQPAASHHHLPN
jgi:hypothetical protein